MLNINNFDFLLKGINYIHYSFSGLNGHGRMEPSSDYLMLIIVHDDVLNDDRSRTEITNLVHKCAEMVTELMKS